MKESEAKEVKEKKVVSETADTTDNKYGVNEKYNQLLLCIKFNLF